MFVSFICLGKRIQYCVELFFFFLVDFVFFKRFKFVNRLLSKDMALAGRYMDYCNKVSV